jgi:hypothetical protein
LCIRLSGEKVIQEHVLKAFAKNMPVEPPEDFLSSDGSIVSPPVALAPQVYPNCGTE